MPTANSQTGLKRALGLWALIIYGIVLIQPTAPMSLFGAAAVQGKGHVVTAILIGMVAMMFTAFSYGRMANAYPNAGSAYAYVSREIHPSLGYFVGWSIIFDYIMNPIICVIWISGATMNFISITNSHEAAFLKIFFIVIYTVLFTCMNLRGIEASARTNTIIAIGLGIVVVLFLGAAARYLFLHPLNGAADWTRPFYDPQTYSFNAVSNCAGLAVLTYIGFDGISTLSEEAKNPRRNILLATVLVCAIIGILSAVQVYLAQLIWPGTDFPNQDTAFCFIAGRAGGQWFFQIISIALIVANFGSGAGAHLGAGRLLYSMGRDNAIPKKFFGAVNPRTHIPANNILLIGALVLIGAFTMDYALGCDLLNFGALIAFMGVNASALLHYFVRAERKSIWNLLAPVFGFLVCAYLWWWGLQTKAHIIGAIWLLTGILYGAWRTNFFRKPMQFAEAGK